LRISIGGQTEDAMLILGIKNYPFTPMELSTKFRSLIKIYHPDTNKNLESEEEAKKLISAYKHLKNLAIDNLVNAEQKTEAARKFDEDEDLFTIWDTCPECNGIGKVEETLYFSRECKPCPDCDPLDISHFSSWANFFRIGGTVKSSGTKILKCKYCKDGKFKLRSGKLVKCRACKGTGIFKRVRCYTCTGSGIIFRKKKEFTACYNCSGIGKIKLNLFNPVIRKGAVLI